jgi:DNA-binding winged helix-turn-helix (wHTH) protein/tetratricopeptide (TPR) repeat protein
MIYTFDGFELDRDAYRLRHHGQVIRLEPQAFELLAYLVAHRDRVVPKEELLDAIWGTRFVSESALTTRIKEARRALGDDGRTQKFIRTVVGHGYQLAVDVIATGPPTPAGAGVSTAPAEVGAPEGPLLVGRAAELALLHGLFEDAAAGQRRVALLGGDAGEGKTSLLEVFLAETRQRAAAWLAVGHAVDHTAPGEPYLPLLDALAQLCWQPRGHEAVAVLRRHAPTWLVQLPGVLSDEDAEALRAVTLGATQERMLREIVEGIEQLCLPRPVVLVLEDLHWSDRPTLEVLAAVSRRTTPARLLVVATYRPGDPEGATAAMVAELAARRPTCHRLVLERIDDEAVARLIGERLGATTADPDLAAFAARRGGGNPLFITTLIEHWAAAGLLGVEEDAAVAPNGLDELAGAVPGDLRLLIQHQTSQLPPDDRELLRAASVVGTTAAAAAVAAAIDSDDEIVEARLHDLARRSNLLASDATIEWRDGTITPEFRFRHSLHQEVLYDAVPPTQRARFHGRVGDRLAAAFGEDADLHAADLAHHYVRSGDAGRAVPALLASATVASRRSAHAEAVEVLTQAEALIGRVRDPDERVRLEANVLATLAPALVAVHGWAAPEVRDTYERALELCRMLPDETPLDAVLYGLATLHEYRAEYGRSQELTEQRLQLHIAKPTSATQVEAHELLACSSFHQGIFEEALQHAETAVAVYDPAEHLALMALHGENPGVSSRHWAAHALWFLGYPDRALAMIGQALELAGDLAHSFSLSHAHEHAAYLHQYRLEPGKVLSHADATLRLATKQGYPYRHATGTMLHGWATAVSTGARTVAAGLDELTRGLDAYRDTGAAMDLPYFLALLAEVLCLAGRLDDASSALDEARSIPRGRGYYFEPELLRLRAEVLYGQGHADLAKEAGRRAIEVARAQQARSLELRAALAALEHAGDDTEAAAARAAVGAIYASFTEGFDTADLQRAKAALGD